MAPVKEWIRRPSAQCPQGGPRPDPRKLVLRSPGASLGAIEPGAGVDEAWSKLKVKQLRREVHMLEREADCVAAGCTRLDRTLLPVGDGRGNAAVISVVRVGFRSKKQAQAFEEVERVQGSGDIRPWEIAAVLGVAGVTMTGLHYASRAEGYGMVIAEADNATGHFDSETLDALAEVVSWIPLKKEPGGVVSDRKPSGVRIHGPGVSEVWSGGERAGWCAR
ncbi:hypothetical protein [Amycolatopsis solani]|uniref:hypothetical protein n=2 Tax=Amycolatopsis solani TaxID=3028615 RepID=UPI0025B0D5FD|nr:hypothetical protein [Amycolatopsis sp. MEP2-6]